MVFPPFWLAKVKPRHRSSCCPRSQEGSGHLLAGADFREAAIDGGVQVHLKSLRLRGFTAVTFLGTYQLKLVSISSGKKSCTLSTILGGCLVKRTGPKVLQAARRSSALNPTRKNCAPAGGLRALTGGQRPQLSPSAESALSKSCRWLLTQSPASRKHSDILFY